VSWWLGGAWGAITDVALASCCIALGDPVASLVVGDHALGHPGRLGRLQVEHGVELNRELESDLEGARSIGGPFRNRIRSRTACLVTGPATTASSPLPRMGSPSWLACSSLSRSFDPPWPPKREPLRPKRVSDQQIQSFPARGSLAASTQVSPSTWPTCGPGPCRLRTAPSRRPGRWPSRGGRGILMARGGPGRRGG
jgi:hypothetical protein